MNKQPWQSASIALVLSVLMLGCGEGTRPAAPASTPPTSVAVPEPPSDPDINLGGGGFTIGGNAPVFAGSSPGSKAFGTISSFKLKLSTSTSDIDVTSVSVSFSGGTLVLSGSTDSALSWSLAGTALSQCTDSCNAYTLPTGLQTLTTTTGTNFSYTPAGLSAVTAPVSTLTSVKIRF